MSILIRISQIPRSRSSSTDYNDENFITKNDIPRTCSDGAGAGASKGQTLSR